ncbi:MAG: acyltransferase family protein [Prevotellaceae bacterium]|jgi:hypothetical protein|nr:acyltransferase family protein [Prevotellaceae bacterium]
MKYNIEILRLIAVVLITFTHTRNTLDSGVFVYIIEDLPQLGTLTLSIISGYLYWTSSKNRKSIFAKKVRTLAIPYLIANGVVIAANLIAYYGFGYNFLNRLSFDYSLITEGLFALNSAPVNPPTYFIRDIFIIFALIELVRNRNFYMLLILVPYAVFGHLLLRYDILALFLTGAVIAHTEKYVKRFYPYIISILLIISIFAILITDIYTYKYVVALLIFTVFFNLKLRFFNVGGFSYLLHLYHSPVIVTTFPLLALYVINPYLSVILQITVAIFACFVIYLLTRKFEKLKILSGGR